MSRIDEKPAGQVLTEIEAEPRVPAPAVGPDAKADAPIPDAGPRHLALGRRVWRKLRSVRFAIFLMALIVVACIVGTLVKQEPYNAGEFAHKYGRTVGSLIGLFRLERLYRSVWFLVLLVLFALSTTACAASRMRWRLRTVGSSLVHGSILFIVVGAVVHGAAGVRGVLPIQEGQTADVFLLDRDTGDTAPLGFRVRLDDFQIRYHENGGGRVEVAFEGDEESLNVPARVGEVVAVRDDGTSLEVLQVLPHFMKSENRIYSASDEPVNPAAHVRLRGPAGESTQWLFANFPEFNDHASGSAPAGLNMRYVFERATVKAYESRVSIVNHEGGVDRTESIQVNSPLKAGRYTLYQVSYQITGGGGDISVLEVVYDPGVSLVMIGFLLMPLGMIFTFYVRPLLSRRGAANA